MSFYFISPHPVTQMADVIPTNSDCRPLYVFLAHIIFYVTPKHFMGISIFLAVIGAQLYIANRTIKYSATSFTSPSFSLRFLAVKLW